MRTKLIDKGSGQLKREGYGPQDKYFDVTISRSSLVFQTGKDLEPGNKSLECELHKPVHLV